MKKLLLATAIAGIGVILLFNKDIRRHHQMQTVRSRIKEFRSKTLQDGDIIFQTSKSSQSKAIQLATHSKYSHMGIIFIDRDKTYVYEAVQPVKLTPIDEWISRGENKHYIIKRLKNSESILTKENLKKLRDVGEKFKGKNYDIYFEWSDNKIYCSELVWKIYNEALGIEIGTLQELGEFDLTNEIVKSKMNERYGRKIPLNEKVISPSAIFESDNLITITLADSTIHE